MKTMFKKTLLAVALAGVGASAHAATVAQTANDYSKQYVASLASTDSVTANFTITLAAEYKNDDVVTIKFSSPLRSAYVAPASVVATSGGGTAIITLGLLSATTDTLTYRVTDVNKTAGNSTIGNVLTFTGVSFNASTLLSVADIKATYSAKTATGNFEIDAGANNTKKILAAADQFVSKVTTQLSGLIELPARTALKVSPAPTNLATSFATTTPLRDAVTFTEVKYTLEGDFSWIKDTNAAAGLQAAAGVVTIPGTCNYEDADSTSTKLVFTCDDSAGLSVAFNPVPNTAAAGVPAAAATAATVAQTLKATKYALSAVTSYTVPAGTLSTLSAADAGEWKVDGVYVDVPYLLAGTVGEKEFSYVVNVTNNHSQVGNVTLDVYKEDGTAVATRVAAGTVAPNAIKRLGSDIKAILGNDFSGRFSAKVFIEVPAGKAQVYSAYSDVETSERAIVINSTN